MAKNYTINGSNNNDSKLALISKMAGHTPLDCKYSMVIPKSDNEMRNMGCSAVLQHLHEVLNRKTLSFYIVDDEDTTVSNIVVRLNAEEGSYTYAIKAFVEENTMLKEYEKQCVEFAARKLMESNRLHTADYNSALQAYNSLGCTALHA